MEDSSKASEIQNSSKVASLSSLEAEVKESSPIKSEDPEAYLSEGVSLLNKGELEKSIEVLSKALEIATKTKGDLDTTLYKFYYTYGDALIIQHFKENDDKMFGDLVPEEVARSATSSQLDDSDQENSETKNLKDTENIDDEEKQSDEHNKESENSDNESSSNEKEPAINQPAENEKTDDLEIA